MYFQGDCRKFWHCYDKLPGKINTCEEGTYFHPTKTYCTTDSSFCRNGELEQNHKPQPVPEQEVVEPGTYGACSSCNGKPEGLLVPVNGDCEKYCVCGVYNRDNAVITQTCPSHLYFNPTKRVCDWPLASGCTPNLVARQQVKQNDDSLLNLFNQIFGDRQM